MHDFAMVGCCWGTKLNGQNIRLHWKSAWNNGQDDAIMYGHHDSWGPDQIFLERYETDWVCFYLVKTCHIPIGYVLPSSSLVYF